jgi:CubicO group peptidase (beta-lactamase class C family)
MSNKTHRSNTRRRVRIVAGALATTAVVLVATAFGATVALQISPPATLVGISTEPPSSYGKLFPVRQVTASSQPRPLPSEPGPMPERVPWDGGSLSFDEFLTRTHTNSFLVVRHGKLVHEWYRAGYGPTTQQPSFSVAKSIVSLLAGRAIGQGILHEDDLVVNILPELRSNNGFDTITVHNLLDMTSGVDVPENYDPWYPLTGTARMMLTTDLDGFIREHRDLAFEPGSKGQYRSVDTQLLGAAVARREGRTLSELLRDELWGPIGAQDDATWNLDHEGGQEKAFCCINATARDYAKVGQLVLADGTVDGTRVIPADWISRIRTPAPHIVDNWGYSAQWWHPTGGNGDDFSAVGIYGQYIYVDPRTQTVIVKLSDHGTEQDEQATIDVFRSIAQP